MDLMILFKALLPVQHGGVARTRGLPWVARHPSVFPGWTQKTAPTAVMWRNPRACHSAPLGVRVSLEAMAGETFPAGEREMCRVQQIAPGGLSRSGAVASALSILQAVP